MAVDAAHSDRELLEEDDTVGTQSECRPPHDQGRRHYRDRRFPRYLILAGSDAVAVVGLPA
jgi:hypothetical protein